MQAKLATGESIRTDSDSARNSSDSSRTPHGLRAIPRGLARNTWGSVKTSPPVGTVGRLRPAAAETMTSWTSAIAHPSALLAEDDTFQVVTVAMRSVKRICGSNSLKLPG